MSERACIAGTLACVGVRALFFAVLILAVACAPPPEREITVALAEYTFAPNAIEVFAAERVRITVRNIGRLEHDFSPDQRGTALGIAHIHLAPNASQSFDWTAPADPTQILITCTIAGHEGFGMRAQLTVKARQ
jgi:uncharacterized cupredoxin-like copper-binding protein